MRNRWRVRVLVLGSVLVLGGGPVSSEGSSPTSPRGSSDSAAANRSEPLSVDENEIFSCTDEEGNLVLQTDPCLPAPKKRSRPNRAVAPGTRANTKAPSTAAALQREGRVVAKPSNEAVGSSSGAGASTRTGTTAPTTGGSWILVPRGRRADPLPQSRFGKQSFPTRLGEDRRAVIASYATPERTWRTFVAAIERGDSAEAAACFTAAAQAKYDSGIDSFPLEDLRAMLASLTRIENGGDLGPLWSIRGVRASRQPKWIFFEESPTGEWKLTGL